MEDLQFIKVEQNNTELIEELSVFASAVVKDYYDPIIGAAQNDYMIKKFQSAESLKEQIAGGYSYYFVCTENEKRVGFIAFYPRNNEMYLSKLYIKKEERGKGYSKGILKFLKKETAKAGLDSITLNVNRNNTDSINIYGKLGFSKIREEKNDIGNGFYMDDFVFSISVS